MFGLKDSDIETLRDVLRAFPGIEEAVIFGSRAMGNYRRGSEAGLVFHEIINLLALLAVKPFDRNSDMCRIAKKARWAQGMIQIQNHISCSSSMIILKCVYPD